MLRFAVVCMALLAVPGCAVVSVGASAVGAAVDVAGSAAGAAIDVSGSAASGAVDLATSSGEEAAKAKGEE